MLLFEDDCNDVDNSDDIQEENSEEIISMQNEEESIIEDPDVGDVDVQLDDKDEDEIHNEISKHSPVSFVGTRCDDCSGSCSAVCASSCASQCTGSYSK